MNRILGHQLGRILYLGGAAFIAKRTIDAEIKGNLALNIHHKILDAKLNGSMALNLNQQDSITSKYPTPEQTPKRAPKRTPKRTGTWRSIFL